MAFSFKANVEEFEKSAEVRGGSFDLLPKGFYEVDLIDVKAGTGKADGNYSDVTIYNLTLKLTDSNEVGVGQRLWQDIFLIQKWRNQNKTDNFTLNQFIKAAGLIDEEGNVEIPDADELLDMSLTFGIKVRLATEKERTDKTGKVHPERNVIDGFVTLEELEKQRKDQKLEAVTEKVTADTDSKANGLFKVG